MGVDHAGAKGERARLKRLRVYLADRTASPQELAPPPSLRKYWTRRGIAEWLVERLSDGPPAIVGIDHGFSFPMAYFTRHGLRHDWPAFLDDFCRHWPTGDDHVYVDFVRDGAVGNGAARTGNTRWKRLTETRAGSAKSVFHFDVQGSVAKSTHDCRSARRLGGGRVDAHGRRQRRPGIRAAARAGCRRSQAGGD